MRTKNLSRVSDAQIEQPEQQLSLRLLPRDCTPPPRPHLLMQDDQPTPPPNGGGAPAPSLELDALVLKATAGDRGAQEALEAILEHEKQRHQGIARRKAPPGEEDDAYQDGYITILQQIETFDPTRSGRTPFAAFQNWSATVMRNAARKLWRSHRKQRLQLLDPDQLDELPDQRQATMPLEQREVLGRVLALVETRDTKDQCLVQLLLKGHAQSTIAITNGNPSGTIRSRTARLRAHIRRNLPSYCEGA